MARRHCLTLDLKNDPALIAEYQRYHENVWPEVQQSLRDSGILDMEIYLWGTRMFMIIETSDSFSFAKKGDMDRNNPKVMEWEALMGRFQQPLTDNPAPEARWLPMTRVFKFTAGT
jgi:L-rhamnose mutarotase